MTPADELLRLAETLLLVSRYESGEASVRRVRVELGRELPVPVEEGRLARVHAVAGRPRGRALAGALFALWRFPTPWENWLIIGIVGAALVACALVRYSIYRRRSKLVA